MCGCELFQDEGQFCVGAPRTLATDHHQGLAKLSALRATVPILSMYGGCDENYFYTWILRKR